MKKDSNLKTIDKDGDLDNEWAVLFDSHKGFRPRFTKRYRLKIWSLEIVWALDLDLLTAIC